ncbi:MAG: MBL fold metallo-hydrolase [Bradyrhizobium sp.]|uniref:MBL fold metallo-hydrolase n=1 Tax=Bradyrhizobium sp. TaxID=376 RepID=UPI001DF5798B|nr:MBL fold metallo-hydrolase [Bradyrhizobium sp.]MBV9563741.1 MBL fold metallo-hydrolase [Bradyrhizobium sp.]
MLRLLPAILAVLGALAAPAVAQNALRPNAPPSVQDAPRSECLAMASRPPRATPVSLRQTNAESDQVTITYGGHSTYFIDTPGGVRIATDYSGAYQTGRLPDVVTMNRAHSTHYTLFPDQRIRHVLHGWGDNGEPAKISKRIGDVLIRNVTTDIRRFYGDTSGDDMIKDGNSIFIFEVAGLCIGHLGHLHVKLDDSHYAAIGRLDVVMVPIDGTYTMSLDGVSEITRRLRASVVLPMHRFATPLHEFMDRIGKQFEIDRRSERTLRISRDTLPTTPTVIILDGV